MKIYVVQAARNAFRNGAPFCRIFITTPGNIDSEPVESSKDTRNNATRWSDRLYDLSIKELYQYLDTNSRNKMFYIEYSYTQLGKGEDWYQEQCQALEFDKIRIKREIHLQRIRGSSDSPFDEEDLDIINGLQKQCISEILLNKIYSIRLYEKIKTEVPYIVGVDCSTGTNNDNTAITIIDPYNERAVGEFKSPLMDVTDICTFIRLLIRKVVPRAILAIERNSLGDAVIQMLKKTEVSGNLYYDRENVTTNSTDKLDAHGFIKQEAENRRFYGVQTNIHTREIMMQILYRLVAEKKESFAVEYVISDLNNLIKKKSGKIEARSGEHDDCIMSFLIGMYVRYHGKKLYMWGFKPGSTPTDDEGQKIRYEDIYDEMDDKMKEYFPKPEPQRNPYEDQLREAIMDMQRNKSNFSLSDRAVVTKNDDIELDYTKITEDDYDQYDDDFFKDLNS